jgi:hypothetical protein
MDGQPSMRTFALSCLLALGLLAGCAASRPLKPAGPAADLHPSPESPASTKPLSTSARKHGFGAAGEFIQ